MGIDGWKRVTLHLEVSPEQQRAIAWEHRGDQLPITVGTMRNWAMQIVRRKIDNAVQDLADYERRKDEPR